MWLRFVVDDEDHDSHSMGARTIIVTIAILSFWRAIEEQMC